MLRNRQLHIKVFVVYTLILITLTLLVAIPINWFVKESLKQTLDQEARSTLENISTQLDAFYNEYNQITKYFYLNQDHEGYTPIEYFDILKSSPSDAIYIKTHNALMNSLALNSEVYENITRISLLTDNFLLLSSKNNSSNPFKQSNYVEAAREKAGDVYVKYNSDPWNQDNEDPVMIFTRQLRISNHEIGFLEVQFNGFPLHNLSLMNGGTIAIYNEDGSRVLYQSDKKGVNGQKEFLREMIDTRKSKGSKTSNGQVQYYIRSNHSNFHLLYSVKEEQFYASLSHFNFLMAVAILFLIFLTAGAFFITAKKLTFPLRNLKNVIDNISLEEEPSKIENQHHLNEIDALNRSFQLMNKRLQNSLEKIVQFHTSEIQLKFKLLQAQINPHFIFNMLGVVTILAKRGKNKEVEEISRKLADFLRYTTSSDNTNQTYLIEEIKFTETYLALMKTRYIDRLTFTIDIPRSMESILIPKMMIQPIVENCLTHGFTNNKVLNINIKGVKCEKSWEIVIQDNGPGFKVRSLEKLHNQIGEYNSDSHKHYDLSIGGMGILSTYIRLNLFYSNNMIFDFGNMTQGGAFVAIGGSNESNFVLNKDEELENSSKR
ncbi:sensor histidine kinase [Metabacillus endolithicus]|uniref:Sensor histidine kinase n=1 Tax=Metabacillus endolithicus TaxID=1535204 RepID=A0ABW5C0J8_9BACI|nr:histidine kinase [Metabacillus endolithicus]UPG62626.1 histidine kinase [Metabacillus endolithicus]